MLTEAHTKLITEVAGHLHAGQRFDAARVVLRFSDVKKDPKTQGEALEPLTALYTGLLNMDEYSAAASLLWPTNMFNPRPAFSQRIWKALKEDTTILLMGSSSSSKSFSAGVFFLLDWLRDPEYTAIKLIGPSEKHLKDNLFSHVTALHTNASLPLPGKPGDLFIGFRKNTRAAITGVVVPLGKRGAGRIQGTKRFPRRHPHPQFGALSRLRILLDEIEKIPEGIFSDLDNVVSTVEGNYGLKVVGAFNPEITGGPVYQRAEPPNGWQAFDVDKDFEWTSKRGWRVVRLDSLQCENVVEGRVIYPGLQTKEGLEALAQKSGGTTSAGYYTFGRAAYPPQGTSFSVIPGTFLNEFRAKYIFIDRPRLVASVDSALEGGDPAMVALGSWGLASGIEFPPSLGHPDGRTVMFQDKNGQVHPRWGLQLDRLFTLEAGDTIKVSKQIHQHAKLLRLDPNYTMLDRTGNGSGVHDWLKDSWSDELRGVNYSEGATHTKIMLEDHEFCDESFERVYSELWFAMRSWIEFGVLKINPDIEEDAAQKLIQQLTGRLYRTQGTRRKVESKQDYKHRNLGFSPNEADALSLLIHGVRMASAVAPSMALAISPSAVPPRDYDLEETSVRIGVTDRFDDLEAREEYFSIGRVDEWM